MTDGNAFGRVDAIVYCAAVPAYGRFDDLPADVFDQVIRTSFGGTANVARSGPLTRRFGPQRNQRVARRPTMSSAPARASTGSRLVVGRNHRDGAGTHAVDGSK